MSDTTASLLRKMRSAGDLHSVVRTMKALAASNIVRYGNSVDALAGYYRTVEMGLGVCLRREGSAVFHEPARRGSGETAIGAIVFGSDQGMVGQFNDGIADFAINTLRDLGGKFQVWAVGERVHARLVDAGVPVLGLFPVPNSVEAITGLVGQIQIESEAHRAGGDYARVYLFYNRANHGGLVEPISQQLLPLDSQWPDRLVKIHWTSGNLPEVIGGAAATLRAFTREYLFISLFRACAESLASENATRLAAMERADKNIGELLENLGGDFNRLRQSAIDEELFDVIAGFEALNR